MAARNAHDADDSYRGHLTALLAIGLPLIGSHVAQMLTHLVDTLMLGWYGVEELAASVLGGTLFFELFIVGGGFGMAVMPLVAAAVGQGDARATRRATRMGMWIAMVCATLVLPVMWFAEPIFLALGQNPELAALGQDYTRVAMFGMFPALLIMSLKSALAAMSRTQIVLWATIISTLVNAGLNWLLIFGNWGLPEMGLRGAALASVIAQSLGFGIMAGFALWVPAVRRYELFVRLWRPDRHGLAEVFRLGWPISITMLAESSLFTASAVMMGWIGTVPLAAHGIAIQVAALTFMIHLGLSNAATVRAGHALGAGDLQGLRKGAITVAVAAFVVATLAVAAFLTFPEPLIRVFLDPSDPDAPGIVAVGVGLIAVAAAFQFADSAQVVTLGLLRGIKDTTWPMVYAALCYWLAGIPASYVLGFTFGLGGQGIWAGLVVGLLLTALLLTRRFVRLLRTFETG